MLLGIFEKIMIIKTTLDEYKKSRYNIIKRVIHKITISKILKQIQDINKVVIDITLLSDWGNFISIVDPKGISGILAKTHEFENRYIDEIVLAKPKTSISIVLKLDRHDIEVRYLSYIDNIRISKTYKDRIEDGEEIHDKNTLMIIDILRSEIIEFTTKYLKGEFDNGM